MQGLQHHAHRVAGTGPLAGQCLLQHLPLLAALDVQVASVANRIALRGTGTSSGGALLNSSGLGTASLTGQILLGTDVAIQTGRKPNTGKLQIAFYSLEQFEGLITSLGIKPSQINLSD